MNAIKWSHILPVSHVDGPGRRAVLFMGGCSIGRSAAPCRKCQNRHLWPDTGWQESDPREIADRLYRTDANAVTVSGGEPFDQPEALRLLVETLREYNPAYHIIVYTGRTWNELFGLIPPDTLAHILANVDVIVDGRFNPELDSPMMQYRGSANQRPIDVRASLYSDKPVVLDWESPQIIAAPEMGLIAPIGFDWDGLKQSGFVRRCGETDARTRRKERDTSAA